MQQENSTSRDPSVRGSLPDYDDLPPAPHGGRSAWGMFGNNDQVGLINLMTPDRVVSAAALVRKGAVFPLDAPVDAFDPAIADARGVPRHRVLHMPGTIGFDDVYDNFYPQGSSQWDSLGHIGYAPDQFYNGATEADVASGRRNTIEHWARRGIVGRAVLLDMCRLATDEGRPYDPGTSTAFDVADLERARSRTGLGFSPGDVLILHTGFARWYLDQSRDRRLQIRHQVTTPGLAHTEEMCRYLWDAHVAAIVSDTFAVEAFPADRSTPIGFLHRILIGQFGMALGELWWTEDLAADCAQDGVYEAMLTSAPIHAAGGIGSPANALAIK
ncbi:MAG: cyclase family protein [Streptosporangiaceae bacterium]|nr:cyclase family protein [Streptosporangiaceae bacterium]